MKILILLDVLHKFEYFMKHLMINVIHEELKLQIYFRTDTDLIKWHSSALSSQQTSIHRVVTGDVTFTAFYWHFFFGLCSRPSVRLSRLGLIFLVKIVLNEVEV